MADNNTTVKKQFGSGRENPVGGKLPTKDVNYRNRPGKYDGQLSGGNVGHAPFAEPMNKGAPAAVEGLEGLHNDIGEQSGFITEGYLDKGETPFGEDAKLNFLPPGMDIDNQHVYEAHVMPLRKVIEESYPGDGWMPKPGVVEE